MNPAYHDTVFEYIPNAEIPDFWVITAYNPDGRDADTGENLTADYTLRSEIVEMGFTPLRIIGMSPEEEHAEPSWGIPCDETTAVYLGRRFRQEAVFHFSAGEIWLVDCIHGVRQTLANPAGRIRNPRENRHFSLFVGSPRDSETIDDSTLASILSCIGSRFEGFTLQKAEGSFQSRSEEAVVIHISTREPNKVIALAHELRCVLNQIGIGISHNGIYQRVRDWTDDELILQSFGIVLPHSVSDISSSPI